MFGNKWKGQIVVKHTGAFASGKRKAIKEANKHGYEYLNESFNSVTFKKRGS